MGLARRGRFDAHGYCQSSVMLLNLLMIALVMSPAFHRQVQPNLTTGLGDAYYAVAAVHASLGALAELLGLYVVLVAGTNVVPKRLRFTRYKPWMCTVLVLWWLGVLLGIGTYSVWYLAPSPKAAVQASGPARSGGAASDGVSVTVKNYEFRPRSITVAVGTTVEWVTDAGRHTIEGDDASFRSVYGQGAEDAFLPLWRRHIGFFVDYTVGVATKDTAKQDKAVNDLIGYTQDFGAFLSSANPNLPKAVVADLVKTHVLTLKDVVDAQAVGDQSRAYTAIRTAVGHMQMVADPLAAAIVKQFPDRFGGSASSQAATLRVTLNSALREHVLLAGSAPGAALGGRDAEFKAAAAALDANSVDVSKAIGSVNGRGAEDAFLPLWRKHIGFFVDYTVAVATKDMAKQDKAVNDLIGYTQDFGAFLSSANPNLPKAVVADLVKSHVLTLKNVVDPQAAGDAARAYTNLRAAAGHMQMIADPLAAAIVKQFPNRYASLQ